MADTHDTHGAISRRNILILGGVAIVTAALPIAYRQMEPDHDGLATKLMALLADPEAAARLGRAWQASHNAPHDKEVITAALKKRLTPFGWQDGDSVEDLRASLVKSVRHDFASNDMIGVGDWQLARTSLELCALAASMTKGEPQHDAPAHG